VCGQGDSGGRSPPHRRDRSARAPTVAGRTALATVARPAPGRAARGRARRPRPQCVAGPPSEGSGDRPGSPESTASRAERPRLPSTVPRAQGDPAPRPHEPAPPPAGSSRCLPPRRRGRIVRGPRRRLPDPRAAPRARIVDRRRPTPCAGGEEASPRSFRSRALTARMGCPCPLRAQGSKPVLVRRPPESQAEEGRGDGLGIAPSQGAGCATSGEFASAEGWGRAGVGPARLPHLDPDGCAETIARLRDAGVRRLLPWMGPGGMPHDLVVRSMRLFAEEVAPRFR